MHSSRRPSPDPRRSPARPLKTLLARRRRACRALGVPVPREVAHGPPETLAWRVATLDRWIGRTLDRAGGMQLPDIPIDEPPDGPSDWPGAPPSRDEEDDAPEDEDDDLAASGPEGRS